MLNYISSTPFPTHVNCRCGSMIIPDGKRTAINDLGSMLAAKLLLMDTSKRIIIPSEEEWIGLNCLERDDDLPNRRKDA